MDYINNIVMKKIWEDDEMLEISITCSSSIISATTQVYVTKQGVSNLYDQLEKFYTSKVNSFEWASGEFGNTTTACISFSFYRKDSLGHIIIEVTMELDDGALFSEHNCCFYVHTELGLLHGFYSMLPSLLKEGTSNTIISLVS